MDHSYEKLIGEVGVRGVDYQLKLYMLYLLRGYSEGTSFHLSCENAIGGKFDDLVYEDGEVTVVLQAKYSAANKKLSSIMFFSDRGNFSLSKYLTSYMKIKDYHVHSKTTYVVCTNIDVNKELSDNFLIKGEENIFHSSGDGTENEIYSFDPSNTLIKLKQQVKFQEEEICTFLKNFRLITTKDRDIERSIKEMLNQCLLLFDNKLDINLCCNYIYDKIRKWFSSQKATYLTNIHLDAYFSEMANVIFLKNLKQHQNKIMFPDIQFSNSQQVIMIETSTYLIVMEKLCLQLVKNTNNVLFVAPELKHYNRGTFKAFQLSHFTHLICKLEKNDHSDVNMIQKLLSEIVTKKYKQIIILVENHFDLNCVQDICHYTDINFYHDVKISKDFKTNFVTTISGFYKPRTYIETGKPSNVYLEDSFFRLFLEGETQVVMLIDGPEMGKSAVISNLTNRTNACCQNRLAVKIDLNNYTQLFQTCITEKKSLELKNFFNLDSFFDEQILLIPGILVLLFDGLDEIYSEHVILFLTFLMHYRNTCTNKIIISARPDVDDLIRKENFLEGTSIFHLQPLTKDEQFDFISEYWITVFGFQERDKQEECRKYGQLLMKKLSSTISNSETLTGIPLLIKMLSEIFQEKARKYCLAEENERLYDPILTEDKWNISTLYEMFIIRQKDIFIQAKSCGSLNRVVVDSLERSFENSLDLCSSLAISIVFPKDVSAKLVEEPITKGNIQNMCDSGLVIHSEGDVKFQHRTFAEFLIAKRLYRNIINKKVDVQYLIQYVFNSWNYESVHLFFENILDLEWTNINPNIFDSFGNAVTSVYMMTQQPVLYQLTKHKCIYILQLLLEKCNKSKDMLNSLDNTFFIYEEELHYYFQRNKITNCYYNLPENNSVIKGNKATLLHCAAYRSSLEIIKYFIETGADVQNTTSLGTPVLHVAVDRGDVDIVEYLIDRGADIHATSEKKLTVLHFAALNGDLSLTKYLIERGSDIHAKTRIGETVLHKAVLGKNLELVQYLIERGVDLHVKTKSGATPLHYASLDNNFEIAKYLIENGANVNAELLGNISVLHNAVRAGSLEIVECLIRHGAEIDAINKWELTPLKYAVYEGNLAMIHYLIENGANLHYTNAKGSTILHEVVCKGHIENVEYLVEKCLNLQPLTTRADEILHEAIFGEDLDTVKYLLTKGTDVYTENKDAQNIQNKNVMGRFNIIKFIIYNGKRLSDAVRNGEVELYEANWSKWLEVVQHSIQQSTDSYINNKIGKSINLQERDLEVLKFLLTYETNVNAKTIYGETVLHKAVSGGWLETIKCLKEHHVELDARNENGETALHKAAADGNLDIAKYLIDQGADFNAEAKHKETVLYKAVSGGWLELVKYLIHQKVNLHATNDWGDTALHKAAADGNIEIMKYLIENGACLQAENNVGETVLDVINPQIYFSIVEYLNEKNIEF